jgi:diguanylate cyclase (GGDEF)-like protein
MNSPDIITMVNVIGLSTQVAAAILLALLFQLLHTKARRKRYFTMWSMAWVSLAVSLATLLPAIRAGGSAIPGSALPSSLYLGIAIYQVGKISFLVFLLAGTLLYTRGGAWRKMLIWGLAIAVPYGLATVITRPEVSHTILWQAIAVIPVTAFCSLLLLRLPAQRRSLGSRLSGAIFALKAIVWIGNLGYTWQVTIEQRGSLVGWAAWISEYGAFLDLLLDVLLGIGMVLLLMEETVREVSSAYNELAVTHSHLERDSYIDPLTGSFNRMAFKRGYGMQSARASYGTVAVFDLDDLKTINDMYGHQAGDQALQHFAESLRSVLRPSDKIFRWGGDEFLAVFPFAKSSEIQARLRSFLINIKPLQLKDSVQVKVKASMGVADYPGGNELDSAIKTADTHMYTDKRDRK